MDGEYTTHTHQTFNMAMKYLCRLCAKEDVFSKDLLLESNKGVLKMIKDFIQISINGNDNLPTRICLNCEEKMVTFQLFVLECYKVQEILQQKTAGNNNPPIKREFSPTSADSIIKSEVKCEMSAELMADEIVSALHSDQTILSEVIYENDYNDDGADDDHVDDGDDDDDDLTDDITIATLKKIKQKVKLPSDPTALNEVLKSPNVKVKDLVKYVCVVCDEKLKSWSCLQVHYIKKHKSEPVVVCMCGFEIRSKSVLYKHVTDHKLESKKLRRNNANEEDKQEDMKYSNLNVRDFVKFKCHECGKECTSWYSLRAHCEGKHGTLPVVQCNCGITLKSKSVLYKHIHDHKNPNILSCDKCPKVSKTVAALNKHKMRHVPKSERKFFCSGCDKIFNTKDALKSHERSHIPIQDRKIYHCEVCNLKFTTRSSAASHKKVVHEKIKGYVCDLCGYACGTNGELRQHRAIHSDDKPFVCNKCSKPFKTYSNLKTHMDTHEDTAYECYICRRILNSRRTLRKHLLVHEDKCRHICSYCNKAFKRRQTLKVHMYTHTGDKPLTCKWCEERFAYASTLRSHRLRCHPDKMAHQAHNTYSSYASEGEVATQNYIKETVAAVSGHVHSSNKNEVPMYTHTGDKPLTCQWCEERFAYASTLRSHRLRCHPDKMADQEHNADSSYASVEEN